MERGADIGDLQLMLGHHQLETTRRSYARGQETRMRRMSQLLNGRLVCGAPTKS
jgi:site-specific recombinase XerD